MMTTNDIERLIAENAPPCPPLNFADVCRRIEESQGEDVPAASAQSIAFAPEAAKRRASAKRIWPVITAAAACIVLFAGISLAVLLHNGAKNAASSECAEESTPPYSNNLPYYGMPYHSSAQESEEADYDAAVSESSAVSDSDTQPSDSDAGSAYSK